MYPSGNRKSQMSFQAMNYPLKPLKLILLHQVHLPTASEMATSLQIFWRIWTFIFPFSLEDIDTKRPGGIFCWKWHTQIWDTLPYSIFVCSDMNTSIEDDAALKACADMCCVVLCRLFDFGFALTFALTFAFAFFPCLCLFSVCACLALAVIMCLSLSLCLSIMLYLSLTLPLSFPFHQPLP